MKCRECYDPINPFSSVLILAIFADLPSFPGLLQPRRANDTALFRRSMFFGIFFPGVGGGFGMWEEEAEEEEDDDDDADMNMSMYSMT